MEIMKRVIILMQLLCCYAASAQPARLTTTHTANLNAQKLRVGYAKTTNLIFPSALKSVDRGSSDILVQKTPGAENVLRVKAGFAAFPETNLSVITADGQFYAFDVTYDAAPLNTTILVNAATVGGASSKVPATVVFSETGSNETWMRKLAAQASITPRNIKGVSNSAYGMELSLKGLYISGTIFFYKLLVCNNSQVSYEIAQIQTGVMDRKKLKRVATQEVNTIPLMVIGAERPLQPKEERMIIIAMNKQTITSDKKMVISLDELSGGRNLRVDVKSNILLRARPIVLTKDVEQIPNVVHVR